jgi:hypothetical protein
MLQEQLETPDSKPQLRRVGVLNHPLLDLHQTRFALGDQISD